MQKPNKTLVAATFEKANHGPNGRDEAENIRKNKGHYACGPYHNATISLPLHFTLQFE